MSIRILVGDCRELLQALPDESVNCVVTSPPYWGLRDYGIKPSLWGGSPECRHDFSNEVLDRSRRSPGTQGGSLTGDGRYQATACRFEIRSNFCVHCNAWRGTFGLEPDYQMFVEHAVEVFREVRRVLRQDGTVWLNLGDSYATGAGAVGDHPGGGARGAAWAGRPVKGATSSAGYRGNRKAGQSGKQEYSGIGPMTQPNRMPQAGLKPKDLCGIPWRVAFALQADGWWLRQDIIWSKPNPMPESIRDRCTKAHEYLFLLSKSERYFYDADAVAEPVTSDRPDMAEKGLRTGTAYLHGNTDNSVKPKRSGNKQRRLPSERGCPEGTGKNQQSSVPWEGVTRNKRSVWTVTTSPYPEAHFATFPPALIEPCILAGCPQGGVVLDPFGGAGTTGLVADRLGRDALLIELNPEYAAMAERRINGDAPLLTEVSRTVPAEAAE
jgi:DNA modification methylase